MPRTARQAFLELHDTRTAFSKLAETSAFDTACEYALLAYVEEMPGETEPNAAWGAHCRAVGAREVLVILRTLHQKQETPIPYRPPQLTPPK